MRLSEFRDLVDGEFGTVPATSLLVDHVLIELGGRTPSQAIEDGVEPRRVWEALCKDFDVPRARW